MPYRPNSRLRNGFSAFADYLANSSNQMGQYFLKQADRQDANRIETDRLKSNDLSKLGMDVASHPNDYESLIQGAQANPRLKGMDFSSLVPSDNTLLAGLTDKINQAKSEADLPASVSAAAQSAGVKPLPALPFGQGSGQQFADGPGSFDAAPQNKPGVVDLQNLIDTVKGKLASQQAGHVTDLGNQAYASAYGSSSGQTQAATDNRDDINENSSTKAFADTHASNLGANQPDVATLSAAKAGKEASARSAAEAPYQAPTFGTDADGNDQALRFGPGGATPVKLPDGFTKTTPAKLSGSQAMDVASLNTAETTGVKVLAALNKKDATGHSLAQSNDPMDPRWNKFVVSTLKISPGDFDKADIQQRTAFIQASLLRSLMGARPSNMIAELYKAHTPSGDMSGMQLNTVLHDVLEEVGNKRQEFENALGHKPGAFKPVSGMTFEDYRKTEPPPGEPGVLPPLDPTLDAILKRRSTGGRR